MTTNVIAVPLNCLKIHNIFLRLFLQRVLIFLDVITVNSKLLFTEYVCTHQIEVN